MQLVPRANGHKNYNKYGTASHYTHGQTSDFHLAIDINAWLFDRLDAEIATAEPCEVTPIAIANRARNVRQTAAISSLDGFMKGAVRVV